MKHISEILKRILQDAENKMREQKGEASGAHKIN
jgi:hypothetical protein